MRELGIFVFLHMHVMQHKDPLMKQILNLQFSSNPRKTLRVHLVRRFDLMKEFGEWFQITSNEMDLNSTIMTQNITKKWGMSSSQNPPSKQVQEIVTMNLKSPLQILPSKCNWSMILGSKTKSIENQIIWIFPLEKIISICNGNRVTWKPKGTRCINLQQILSKLS